MNFQSEIRPLEQRELAEYGKSRARDLAFDAVYKLWRRREAEGMQKKDIATILGRDPAWVTRCLRGPGNWTMGTFGELVVALRGEIYVDVVPVEQPTSM